MGLYSVFAVLLVIVAALAVTIVVSADRDAD